MPSRRNRTKISITGHAYQRWRERGGMGKLTEWKIKKQLISMLEVGAEVVEDVISVPVENLVARCAPEIGCWVVITVVYPVEENID